MGISSERRKDTLIVKMDGELDHHHAGEIRDMLDDLLYDVAIKNLILDLERLHFMDSSGIGVFIGRYKIITKRGGQVCIVNVNQQLAKILDVSGLYKILKVYGNINDALNGMRGEQ